MKKWILAILSMAMVSISIPCFAGNIDSPGDPSAGSGMYTLLQLYNYFNYGTVPSIVTSFQEPSAGPGSTMKTTKNIYDDTKTKFDQCDAQASDVATGKKFFSPESGNWGVKTGSGLVSSGNAVVGDVLATKTFSNSSSAGLTGTMPTNTLTAANDTVSAGYYAATTLTAVDAELAAGNIKKDVAIFGVTGTYPLAAVARTGQTPTVPQNPAPAGSDGNLQKGVAWPSTRFTDNNNGTVTDNLTGLIWLKDANCDGQKTWANALHFCNTLAHGSCGLTDSSSPGDWRLPNVKELFSLIDFAYISPALSNDDGTAKWGTGTGTSSFTGVQSNYYWSSSTAGSTYSAWSVNLSVGNVTYVYKDDSNYVWPVRSGN